jgi:Holliday junction resolvase RusA-like endonuclease
MRIGIKPLSVNKAWQGKRYKTKDYKEYEKELWYLLPNIEVPKGKIKLKITVGYKNKLADIDNFIKPFVDVAQKKYGFNDNQIYRLEIDKEVGDEFIDFRIEQYK